MNTQELIEELTRSLAPVRPLWSPRKRAAVWSLAAILYVICLTVVLAAVGGGVQVATGGLFAPHVAAIGVASFASYAAFASVVPGHPRSAFFWPLLAIVAWIATYIFAYESVPATEVAVRQEWHCVVIMVVGGAPLIGALMLMLRRGAAFAPRWAAAWSAIAVSVLMNVSACLWQPHPNDHLLLLWHGGALVTVVVVCVAAAPALLAYHRRLQS